MMRLAIRLAPLALLVRTPTERGRAQIARALSADTTFFAEGIDVDSRTGALYVTSLHHRNDFVTDANGGLRPLIQPSGAPIGGVFGVVLDTPRDIAWVAAAKVPFMSLARGDSLVLAELLRIALRDGRISGRWTLGDGTGMPDVIALAPDGSVFVSDGLDRRLVSRHPALGPWHRQHHRGARAGGHTDPWRGRTLAPGVAG